MSDLVLAIHFLCALIKRVDIVSTGCLQRASIRNDLNRASERSWCGHPRR